VMGIKKLALASIRQCEFLVVLQGIAVENSARFEVFEIQRSVVVEDIRMGRIGFGQRNRTAVHIDEALLRLCTFGGVKVPVEKDISLLKQGRIFTVIQMPVR